ncbi:lysylphosphatidylglycerol synthase transmembrane domain-containing protein [Flavobacterium silvaticum]|uniref:lysylphosphatidylglycerol synthase transmembrane domain-containing protein n=1 Tax=Flavobacterium silvaticum TaxID=1852020 RepID=UPI00293B9173|nr:lysylphosphatidylglycerol synthase transmembrane domain-containing protein [Flavobacterium silvaticum]
MLLPIGLGFYLIYYTYTGFTPEQIDEIKGYFKDADYSFILLAGFISVLSNASRAWRWKYPLAGMGYKVSFANCFMAVNAGYLLNLTVPKSGEISRAVILKKYEDVPFDKGFGTIVAERIVDMIILLLFIFVAFFLQFDIVKAFILDQIPLNKLLLYGGIGIGFCTVGLWVYAYSKSKFILALKEKVSGLKEGLFSLWKMEHKWEYLAHTVFIWFSFILTFYVTLFVFEPTKSLSVGATISAFVVGSMAIAFTNSGFGSYPFLIAKILLFYAIPETVGNAFGWIVWTSQMLVVLALGLGSFLLLPILNRTK